MTIQIYKGDSLEVMKGMESNSVNCCVTSPPYWGLRDYNVKGQMGLEKTPEEFVEKMVTVFGEVKRLLRSDGTLWLNIGDSYAGKPGGGQGVRGQRASRTFAAKTNFAKAAANLKPKDLVGIPWMLAFALRADGWYLRQEIIWSKKNTMPESVNDRCTKSHESIFLLTKSPKYYFDFEAIMEDVSLGTHARLSQDVQNQIGSTRANGGAKSNGNMKAVGRKLPGNITSKYEPDDEFHRTKSSLLKYSRKLAEINSGTKNNASFDRAMAIMPQKRNKRSVWEVASFPFKEAHFATFPPKLIEPCILAGCPKDGAVLDPFFGAGTTGLVADRLQRNCIGIELNPEYIDIAERRIKGDAPLFTEVNS